ncbi:hypothetical protein HDU87_000448 [Geranomyces variabilis]|uniref:C2H2-type domain-containing protein n=1 Tax=Geranomyces variabilis TaxID=109894 RepID=A0AAD5XT77_9FUNG|nr:hypothetical protein HDU87_000448 [Geranomyces variabilis]
MDSHLEYGLFDSHINEFNAFPAYPSSAFAAAATPTVPSSPIAAAVSDDSDDLHHQQFLTDDWAVDHSPMTLPIKLADSGSLADSDSVDASSALRYDSMAHDAYSVPASGLFIDPAYEYGYSKIESWSAASSAFIDYGLLTPVADDERAFSFAVESQMSSPYPPLDEQSSFPYRFAPLIIDERSMSISSAASSQFASDSDSASPIMAPLGAPCSPPPSPFAQVVPGLAYSASPTAVVCPDPCYMMENAFASSAASAAEAASPYASLSAPYRFAGAGYNTVTPPMSPAPLTVAPSATFPAPPRLRNISHDDEDEEDEENEEREDDRRDEDAEDATVVKTEPVDQAADEQRASLSSMEIADEEDDMSDRVKAEARPSSEADDDDEHHYDDGDSHHHASTPQVSSSPSASPSPFDEPSSTTDSSSSPPSSPTRTLLAAGVKIAPVRASTARRSSSSTNPPHPKPFHCEICPASFSRKHDLKRHTRIHLGIRPFKCDCCQKVFSRHDALSRHLIKWGCGKKLEEAALLDPQVLCFAPESPFAMLQNGSAAAAAGSTAPPSSSAGDDDEDDENAMTADAAAADSYAEMSF